MKKYIDLDVLLGGVLAILAFYAIIAGIPFPKQSGVLPMLVGCLLFISSLVVIYGGIKKTIKIRACFDAETAEKLKKEKDERKMAIMSFLFCTAYVLLIVPVGFFLTTTIFMIVYMYYLGVRKWITLLGVALGTSVILYFTFVVQMHVMLPTGILL